MSSYQRLLVHRIADLFALSHVTLHNPLAASGGQGMQAPLFGPGSALAAAAAAAAAGAGAGAGALSEEQAAAMTATASLVQLPGLGMPTTPGYCGVALIKTQDSSM